MKKIIITIFFLIPAIIYSQWTLLNSGTINPFFSCSFINSSTGWVSGYRGQVYFTSNGGINWNMIFDSQTDDRFDCMVFKTNLTGWAGSYQGKVYKTTNGGYNWSIQQILINHRVMDIFFIDINTGWVVGEQGIAHKTTNGGISWQSLGISGPLNCIYFINSSIGFIGGDNFFYKSTDGGLTWNGISIPTDEIVYAISFINNSIGWAMCRKINNSNSSSALSVLRTTNTGVEWNEICAESHDYGWHTMINDAQFLDNNIGYYCGYSAYAPPPSSQSAILYKTTNGGVNWSFINLNTNVSSFEAIEFSDMQTGYLVGYNGKIYKTTNGGPIGFSSTTNRIPDKYSLYQNYPNPFNPTTKIKFSFPLPSKGGAMNVTLKIFDILGHEITSLIPPLWGGQVGLQPGTYEVEWNGSNYASGVYFYKIAISDPVQRTPNGETSSGFSFTETKKLILLK